MITLFPSHVLSRILGSLGSHFYIFRNFSVRFVKLMILSPQHFTNFRNACKKIKAHILSPGDNCKVAAPPPPYVSKTQKMSFFVFAE